MWDFHIPAPSPRGAGHSYTCVDFFNQQEQLLLPLQQNMFQVFGLSATNGIATAKSACMSIYVFLKHLKGEKKKPDKKTPKLS